HDRLVVAAQGRGWTTLSHPRHLVEHQRGEGREHRQDVAGHAGRHRRRHPRRPQVLAKGHHLRRKGGLGVRGQGEGQARQGQGQGQGRQGCHHG
ncbi:hypothetical protein diail_1228, partial [Diaporthe ilicicola]